VALHSLGDEINPPSRNSNDDDEAGADARRRRRDEMIRLNRLELVRQARDDGIAVDLDELAAIGRVDASRSFDDLVGSDGKLRSGSEMAQASGASTTPQSGMRQRGAGARGLDMGAAFANPFHDEAQVLFDRQLIGADGENESVSAEHPMERSRESTRTISPEPLIDTSDTQSQYFSEEEMDAQIEEAIRRSLSNVASEISETVTPDAAALDPPISVPQPVAPEMSDSSFFYAPPPHVLQPPASGQSMYSSAMEAMMQANLHNMTMKDEVEESHTPAGTLTPTEDGFSTVASHIDSGAEDIAAMSDFHSMVDEHEDDRMSDAGYSTDAYSVVGVSTPGSWTDVESEAGDEEGHQGHAPQPPTTTTTILH